MKETNLSKDVNRKKTILLTITKGTLLLSLTAFLVNLFSYLNTVVIHSQQHHGDNPMVVFMFFLFFLFLYFLSRKRSPTLVSLILIFLLYLGATYTSLRWGADVPQALLIYAIVIVLAGILINSRFAFLQTLVIFFTLLTLSYLQEKSILEYDDYWFQQPPGIFEAVTASISLFIITIVSWLSNRELENSLHRAESSEAALKKERDLLETRVEERTDQLKQMQMEKITQLYRFADFGRLASGLMHDLVNPLTSVSLNIEAIASNQAPSTNKAVAGKLNIAMKRAKNGIQRMESYVEAARKQIQQQEIHKTFSIRYELQQLAKIFSYRIKKEHVDIVLSIQKDIHTYGNPVAFHQAISNIIANAFDAYEKSKKKDKKIIISAFTQPKGKIQNIHIDIQDFGKGIAQKDIEKIFQPFFTTKNIEKGTGIGLSITQKTIKESLKGEITVESPPKSGTIFHIVFPLKKKS